VGRYYIRVFLWFIAEPLMMFCGTLVGKHCPNSKRAAQIFIKFEMDIMLLEATQTSIFLNFYNQQNQSDRYSKLWGGKIILHHEAITHDTLRWLMSSPVRPYIRIIITIMLPSISGHANYSISHPSEDWWCYCSHYYLSVITKTIRAVIYQCLGYPT
jgi:hypothetical protein